MKTTKIFKEEVNHVFQEIPINENVKQVIRIIRYFVNDEPGEWRIEKRIMLGYGGTWRAGKAVGLNSADMKMLFKLQQNVMEAFERLEKKV